MPSLGPAEILVILVVALLVFGPNKMPEIGRQVARGVREFRRVQQHLTSELQSVVSDLDPTAPGPASSGGDPVPTLPPRDITDTSAADAPAAAVPPESAPPETARTGRDRSRHRRRRPPRRARCRRVTSTRSRRTGPPVRRASRHPRHPRKPPDPSGAATQTVHSRRPDDGRRASHGTAHATHDLVGRGGGRGDDLLHLRPEHHLVPHPVLQGLDPRRARQADLHRPARRVRHPPEDRDLRRHRARDAGVALAALALHHARPQSHGEALHDPVPLRVAVPVRVRRGGRVRSRSSRRCTSCSASAAPTSSRSSPPTSTSRSSRS